MDFFRFLMSDVLSEPAVLVGLIALIGLIAQKKPVTECIKGTVKTIMGFVILGAGAGLVVSSLGDFANIFQHAFGIQGVVPNNEAIVSVAQKSFGKEMAMIMFFAMVINIICPFHTVEIYLPDRSSHVVYVDDGSGNSGNSRHDRHYAYSRWLFGCWRGNGLFPGYCASVHEESDRF